MTEEIDEQEHLHYEGVFTDLFSAELTPPHWIVRDLLPPGLVFLAADPKVGKSSFAMALASLVAGYECHALPPFLSIAEQQGPVIVFSAEALAGELRHMVEVGLGVRGTPDAGILIADDPWDFRLDSEGGTSRFISWANERKPKLIIIDPLRNFHSQDENDSGAMYSLLRPLRQWAVANDSCVVVVHHTRKASEATEAVSVERMRGTSAMFGMVDGAIVMADGGGGFADVECTFKRAKKWRRKFCIASYDNVATKAHEILDGQDKSVMDAWAKGGRTIAELTALSHVSTQKVVDSVDKLKRNGLITYVDQQGK